MSEELAAECICPCLLTHCCSYTASCSESIVESIAACRDNFRNETLNGQAYDFDVSILSSGALTAGILEFDFVSTDCDHRLALLPPMPDEVFELFLEDLWKTRHKVKLVLANVASDRARRAQLPDKKFHVLFPEAARALNKPKGERGDGEVQAVLAMLKKLDFPIKAQAAVQRMCAVAQFVQLPDGATIAEAGARENDIYILLHGVVKVLGPDEPSDGSKAAGKHC